MSYISKANALGLAFAFAASAFSAIALTVTAVEAKGGIKSVSTGGVRVVSSTTADGRATKTQSDISAKYSKRSDGIAQNFK